ncbi:hypothetical protein G7B40_027010 [Aetokthonos hydrillicola Thurmond2011]|jgi:uncharacterized glyoxalase superfamily protein PhnB|uniref:VOC domain-containing protein n=1 Tax=Aetokthonos hydrillicola Thurmond2011 TaxID=2712845 RepID=A0AAP5IBL1_9CYAN|nr:VOC family protein [Aetokthonos hydrillicola]MBO3462391.1 hypothetical protein [Aetokthonos hydrillicola CCALA 1050]MBW4590382.1 hypothetical protein [Aetokthonos hydrillicola CCALA 1050]MDR9898184.1 hypothetical protein [Aetokthonos hydrillicola Thurmond2011]
MIIMKFCSSNLPAGMEIDFVTDDVSAAFLRAVEAGAVPVAEPEIKPWGKTIAYVRDLDGILIALAS